MKRLPAWILLVFLPVAAAGSRDALADVLARGVIRWGGDEEGGAPYISRAETGESKLVGFEIDLMDLLGRGLGVKPEFKQCDWKNLLNELNQARTIDVAVNGVELTTARLQTSICTIPYFAYELHLFGRADERRASSWNDLRKLRSDGARWVVGVLENTSADQVMSTQFAETVEVKRYSGTTDGFRDVEHRQCDFTVTDTPAALVYGKRFSVRQIGQPIERGYYVMYLRQGDTALRDRLNDLLRQAIRDGSLREIYARYGLWYPMQETLAHPDVQRLPESMIALAKETPGDGATPRRNIVARYAPLLLRAAGVTALLSVVSMPLAIVLGLLIALARLYGPAVLRWPAAIYVEVVRGTPLLLQLLFLYFGLIPWLIDFMPVGAQEFLRPWAAVIASVAGLALNYAAYEAEIYRAGLLAIPRGQMEAGLALGMRRAQVIRHVVVPQAVRLVVPPVTNDFINLFKDTSVCSVITVVDLSKMYNIAVNNAPYSFVELALATAGLYMAMSYPLSLLARYLERRPGGSVL